MASNSGDGVVENLLQCAVCMESYEESGPRTPKMLPCQHSFCVDCLRNISRAGRIQCPSCRKQFSIPVDELSRSFVLIQLLDTIGSSPRNDNVTEANLSNLLKEKFRDSDKAKEYLSKLTEKILRLEMFKSEEIEAALSCIQYYRIPSDTSRSIQITATKFVMNSISVGGEGVTVHLLSEVATELIKTIETFKDDEFSSEVLLTCMAVLALPAMENKSFINYLNLAHLLMTILTTNKNELESKFVEFLTNISARKLSQSDIASIGNKKYVENLLSMLRRKMNTRSRDAIFYNLLSLLAYLTAETPSTCTNIVNAGGITVFAQLLEDNDPVSNKRVLMNLSNLTDVPEICYHFLDGNSGAVECLLKLMNSDEIHISYLSAAVISRLLTIDFREWEKLTKWPNLRNTALINVYNCVLEWGQRASNICDQINFVSFKPFYSLLQRYDAPPLQLFAVWTISKCCSDSRKGSGNLQRNADRRARYRPSSGTETKSLRG
uniref:protein zyg-11 homolog n=1 Tax=Styela clava TaxID=7725 RepID=UPI001939F86C|nr:protein zyg-11 homolog [Styela clava]